MAEQPASVPFIGRQRELADLVAIVEEAVAEHRGRLALLSGVPGIGKSRLAAEVADAARHAGQTVLFGRSWADAGAVPYWPWIQVLRAHLRDAEQDDLGRQVGGGAADLALLLPEVSGTVEIAAPDHQRDPDAARFALFDAVTSLLRRAAERRAIVVVLEDLHAADTPSLLLLRFLASQLADAAIVVVATSRDLEITPDHPNAIALEQLAREPNAVPMRLAGLAMDDTSQLIATVSGRQPDASLVTALWRGTHGNPLFLGEAIQLLDAEGRLGSPDGAVQLAVPAKVRDVIVRRVAHLGEDAVARLAPAAVLGPEFGLDMLRRISDAPAERLFQLAADAVRAGLLADVRGSPGHYRFTHDLIRESLHDQLDPMARVHVHRRIAEALEASPGPGTSLAGLAYHALEAARGAEIDVSLRGSGQLAERAMDYARRAGEQAVGTSAFEEAGRLYRTALSVGASAGVLDDTGRLDLLVALGDVEARAGNLEASRGVMLDAVNLARELGSPRDLALAAIGYGGRLVWARAGNDTRLIPLLQEALVMLGGGDDRLRARLLVRLACAMRSDPHQRAQSAALSQQALDLARSIDDPATLGYVLVGRAWAIWWPDNVEERLALATEMLEIARRAGDAERTVDAHTMLCLCFLDLGRVDRARAQIDELDRLAERIRQPAQLWLGLGQRALISLAVGDFEEAERLMAVSSEMAQGYAATPARDDVSATRMHRFLVARERGTLPEEERSVRASVAEFPWYPLHRAALANVLVEIGRTEEATMVLDDLATDDFAALYVDNEWLLGACLAAEASARLRHRTAAESLYRQLSPYAGRHAVGHPEGSVGATDRYLGLLAESLDRHGAAIEHLEVAVAVNARMGLRPWVAHAQADLADLLDRRAGAGDAAAAAELREAARDAARDMRMSVLEARLTASHAPERPGLDRTARRGDGTFRRDGEFWTIGIDGATTRLRHSRGMDHLARLLARPGEELHAVDLASRRPAAPGADGEAPVHGDPFGSAGPRLDDEAKGAYRERLEELDGELAEAESWNDIERAARARDEREAIARELAAAVGMGGRDRTAASSAERARLSVTRAIRSAMDRIATVDAPLGEHLAATVHTGTYCSYRPDPRVETQWQLGGEAPGH